MRLRTLYLQSGFSFSGRDSLRGRVLFDHFRGISDDALLAHAVATDAEVAAINNVSVRKDFLSEGLFRQLHPNVVYAEGGLFNHEGIWKLPLYLAEWLCDQGGVLIIADLDESVWEEQKELYGDATQVTHAFAHFYARTKAPVYAIDEKRNWCGSRQILVSLTR
jgi:hypothetical protein